MNKKYVVANWKALPESWAEAQGILDSISEYFDASPSGNTSLIVCPPFVFIEEAAKLLDTSSLSRNAELGAQDIALSDQPGQTGEISGAMLEKLNVRYVIIGHSERRWKLGESDEVTNQKLKMTLQHNLTPIVCIGERTREGDYHKFITDQVAGTFAGLSADEIGKCLVTYEPVWAISTNPGAKPDTPADALEALTVIRPLVPDSLLLYGGSITQNNAHDFLSMPEFSGVLVGGASVRKEEFVEILRAAE